MKKPLSVTTEESNLCMNGVVCGGDLELGFIGMCLNHRANLLFLSLPREFTSKLSFSILNLSKCIVGQRLLVFNMILVE